MSSQHHHSGPSDGWHGAIGSESTFEPQSGRYHLYIGLFCPFAHRANLVRHLKGLQDAIDVSIVKPYPKGDDKGWPGWKFPAQAEEYPNATLDKLFGSQYMHEIYFKADAAYEGRYSVPVLWDKHLGTIVSNESAEILRWMPGAFPSLSSGPFKDVDLYPQHLRKEIDDVTGWMQSDLNTGVYKTGFATTQEGYDKNVVVVFEALNRLEKMIHQKGGPYVLGKDLTELDIRLYVTIVRFDPVYVQHFKCNLGTIRHDYPVLNNWLKHLYWTVPAFKETTDFKHIKENYTKSHQGINPHAITPMGPVPDVETGIEDFKKLTPGKVDLPEHASKL